MTRLLVSCLLIVFALTACGDDDKNDSTTSTTSTPAVTTATNSTSTTSIPTTVSVPPTDETSYLTDVKAGAGGEESVTFTFSNSLPGYSIGYVDPPLIADGSGAPVAIGGTAIVEVRFVLASGVNLTGGTTKTYNGPTRFTPPGTQIVKEVVQSGDFEAHLSWGIGTSGRVPFTVTTSSPYSVTITFTNK